MGRDFQCPYCGTLNKIGQRYCSGCNATYYYTCTNCNSIVDPSYKFCPTCSTPLNWTVRPRATLLQHPTTPTGSKPFKGLKAGLIAAAVIVVLAAIAASYIANQMDLEKSLVFEGYESLQEPSDESETYVTAPPNSQYNREPYNKVGPDESFELVNNANAIDVSFEELKTFIMADETDQAAYIPGVRMCGHFAQNVHNNAEAAGIKAAVVIVEFTDGTLHALNAFQTTDKGLIYIDCTGMIRSSNGFEDWVYRMVHPYGQDRMAYMVKSKEYGTIPLEDAESTQYSYYTGYSKGWFMDEFPVFSQPSIVHSVKIYW
jgi:hypothetical protein